MIAKNATTNMMFARFRACSHAGFAPWSANSLGSTCKKLFARRLKVLSAIVAAVSMTGQSIQPIFSTAHVVPSVGSAVVSTGFCAGGLDGVAGLFGVDGV